MTLTCLVCYDDGALFKSYGDVFPQPPVVEIGKNFTATCVLNGRATAATSEDLYWTLKGSVIPEEHYTKINGTALSVTFTVTSQEEEMLICVCKKYLPDTSLEKVYSIQGLQLNKAYFPEKPGNLSCVMPQDKTMLSTILSCRWHPGSRDKGSTYVLYAKSDDSNLIKADVDLNHGSVAFNVFPHADTLDVWVEASNKLGSVESDHLNQPSETFAKPNPPFNVSLISEKSLSKSLLVYWIHPINKAYLELRYQVRYSQSGSAEWTQVPPEDTSQYIQSFRLQSLLSDTEYAAQVRCQGNGLSYWSDWSQNVTARTPEDKPSSGPDLWRVIRSDGAERTVRLISKPPLLSNGRIRSYQLTVQQGEYPKDIPEQSIQVNTSESHSNPAANREITVLGQLTLRERESVKVSVIAHNAAGRSPERGLIVPRTGKVGKSRYNNNVIEYIVEWLPVGKGLDWQWKARLDWQQEKAGTNRTAIKGHLEKFKLYTIQVYPLTFGVPGRPASCQAYLQEAAKVTNSWKTEVTLDWEEIPLDKRRGFITNYTLFFFAQGDLKTHVIPLSSKTYSYTLTNLKGDIKYEAWIMASNSQGSYNGTKHSFHNSNIYGGWESVGIVLGCCFSFLVVVLLTMVFCISKKDSIRKNFWPQVPDPSESTIAAWSPDFPSKAHSPKESVLGDLSVVQVEVEVFDRGSLYEDDKAGLPPKDKDLSGGEHSSGIGGSSCMSSPRQSVSDSEEGDGGGDGGGGGGGGSGQTTASVLYSSVVASSGYKGQSPGAPPAPQQHQPSFARSESTQPLLEGEEQPPDTPVHAQPRNAYCRRSTAGDSEDAEQQETEQRGGAGASLKFSPLETACQQTPPIEEEVPPEWQVPGSSYRSQANGYRPQ
ncbi:interleukin-6 receptor subunit beta [Aplochiton taeniatus]